MAKKNRSNANRGPATDKIDSISEDLNTQDNQEQNQNQEVDLTVDQPAPPAIDSPEDVDDQSGVEPAPSTDVEDDEEEDTEEEVTTRPVRRGADQDEEGMGFPRKNGKTLSIFSNKPHEVVRNVAGVMVPMTREEAVGDSTKGIEAKSDAEAIEKLKKMGKL